MTRLLAALALATFVSTAWADKDREPRLESYTSGSGKFRVKLPGRPKVESKDLATGPGGVQPVPMTTERVEGPDKVMYSVVFADYPDTFQSVNAKTVLDGVRDGMKGKDGQVKEDREILLGKTPGRELRIEAGRKVIRARIYLVGTRLYQVMANGERSAIDGKGVDEFLRSFELVK